ncbi:hypothetical protein HUK80_12885 [Flavobacterium sp. MAH-1]|uniref:Uncharacterized protein n=1 Tax=Flavobacterium agri TaxID=2743471 RepID=A0A7Y9C696_9FLAO|nr:hypothetical protein [Flavobacterium agri]NUY81796.1 hypothetical protein [Flavobacterium agri]NYA71820.1 hypothetical protein [Flavobacterium agri]
MKPEKLHKHDEKAEKETYSKDLFNDYGKVKLRRRQYLTNLMATNKMCLLNNNINTLLLF